MASGHYIFHFVAAVAMFLVLVDNDRAHVNLLDDVIKPASKLEAARLEAQGKYNSTWINMQHGGAAPKKPKGHSTMMRMAAALEIQLNAGPVETPTEVEIMHTEKRDFIYLFISHVIASVMFLISEWARRNRYDNLKQLIQFFIPYSYLLALFKTILLAKTNLIYWSYNMNHIRAWILLEITYFFFSIGAGIAFLFLCTVLPESGGFLHQNEGDHNSFNPYKHKNTSDFLRFIKREYYMFTFQMTLTMTSCFVAFTNIYNFGMYGPRGTHVIWCITIGLVPHVMKLLAYTALMINHNLMKRSKTFSIVQMVVQFGCLIALIVLYEKFDKLKDQNVVAAMWVFFEIIQSGIEPFFFAYTVFVRKLGLQKFDAIGDLAKGAGVAHEHMAKVVETGQLDEYGFDNDDDYQEAEKETQEEEPEKLEDEAREDAFKGDTTDSEDNQDEHTTEEEEAERRAVKPAVNADEAVPIAERPDKWKALVEIRHEVKRAREAASHKKRITFLKEDFIIMTSLCYVKKNVREHTIVSQKRSELFWSAVTANFVTTNMLLCMLYAAWIDEAGKYAPNLAGTFPLFQVKFPCAMALHFMLYPEVNDALVIMKYAHQEAEQFVPGGASIAFFLGFGRFLNAILCESINIYMLSYQHTIQHCIIHFVALEVIMEVTHMYFEAINETRLKEVMEHENLPERTGKKVKFMDRNCGGKIARVIYVLARSFYVSCVFYFVPFMVLLTQWAVDIPREIGAASSH